MPFVRERRSAASAKRGDGGTALTQRSNNQGEDWVNNYLLFYWGFLGGALVVTLLALFFEVRSKRKRKADDNQSRLDQMWQWFISIERHSLASYSNVGDLRRELQQHIADTVVPKRRKTDKKGGGK